jgi:hypothetical protein
MQFLALIYSNEGSEDVTMSELMEQYTDFSQRAHTAGVMEGGNAYSPYLQQPLCKLDKANKLSWTALLQRQKSNLAVTICCIVRI